MQKAHVTMLIVLLISLMTASASPDSLLIMFWNLENFFDWKDGGSGEADREFSSKGERHWTYRKYKSKCAAVAKTILWIGGNEGRMPDIVGVAEVECRKVLRDLAENTPMRKSRYGIVHYDSPDRRGIDVGLLYRKDSLHLARSVPIHISGLQTRDILLCTFISPGEDTLHVLVNHHPSKYGGPSSAGRREAAIGRLKVVCDSLWASGGNHIILMGDFNDTPENEAFRKLTDPPPEEGGCPPFLNLAQYPASQGEGTIRFNGKWDLIDMFFLSPPLVRGAEMKIVKVPFLMVWDNVHPGMKPLRTYSGPRYLGGVSDHLPILLGLKGWKCSGE